MGLDSVEFVIAVEDAFGIAIPNAVAEQLITPRSVVEYVEARLPQSDVQTCNTQRAFYLLRRGVNQAFEIPRGAVTPESEWRELLPGSGFGKKWKRLGRVLGASDWPLASFFGYKPPTTRTVGATAEYVAYRTPALVKGIGASWSRQEIERIVAKLINEELGITSFKWDDRFVEDLRVD